MEGSAHDPERARLIQLIADAAGGSRKAFSELAEIFLPLLSREAGKYVPAADVEDVVQEALIRIHRALPKYQESGRFEFWARRIVSRAAMDFWRETRRRGRLESALTDESSIAPPGAGDLRAAGIRGDLERCLSELSPEDRMVCVMAFLEERTHREIAELVGSTTVAVKVRCFRLKNKLRNWFSL